MLNDMDQEELENLRQINCRELGKMCSRIKKDIVNKYPNRTTDDAIRKTFDIGNNAGVFYVKVMESMLEQWEEYISDEDSAIENKQKGGAIEQGAWRCMNCGETNPDKAKRCMECGKEKGWVPPAEEWNAKLRYKESGTCEAMHGMWKGKGVDTISRIGRMDLHGVR